MSYTPYYAADFLDAVAGLSGIYQKAPANKNFEYKFAVKPVACFLLQ